MASTHLIIGVLRSYFNSWRTWRNLTTTYLKLTKPWNLKWAFRCVVCVVLLHVFTNTLVAHYPIIYRGETWSQNIQYYWVTCSSNRNSWKMLEIRLRRYNKNWTPWNRTLPSGMYILSQCLSIQWPSMWAYRVCAVIMYCLRCMLQIGCYVKDHTSFLHVHSWFLIPFQQSLHKITILEN